EGDRMAGFQDPELFELLGGFEGRGGDRPQAEQEIAAISVEAEVKQRDGRPLPGYVAVAIAGDRAAREVEGAAGPRGDDLDARRVAVDRLRADRGGEGRHRGLGVVLEDRDHEV